MLVALAALLVTLALPVLAVMVAPALALLAPVPVLLVLVLVAQAAWRAALPSAAMALFESTRTAARSGCCGGKTRL